MATSKLSRDKVAVEKEPEKPRPIRNGPRLNRLSWRDQYPNFPVLKVYPELDDLPEEERIMVKCIKDKTITKGGSGKGKGKKRRRRRRNSDDEEEPMVPLQGWDLIPLAVCLHGIFRFNPSSKYCRKCFGLVAGQKFPEEFLNAEKRVFLEESIKVAEKLLDMEKKGGRKEVANERGEGDQLRSSDTD